MVYVNNCQYVSFLEGSLYIPETQMTLGLVEKGLVLRGGPSKIEVLWAVGIYILYNVYSIS